MSANGRHLNTSGRRGTPPEWVEMARTALGGRIELDPMSEPEFNKVVRAERIYTKADCGLAQSWRCSTMLLNPHGGRQAPKPKSADWVPDPSLVVPAWRKLMNEWNMGSIGAAVWIGFSLDQIASLADESYHPLDFSLLIVRNRIDFLNDRLEPGGRPTHANYVVGIGIDQGLFESSFAGRGRFSHGRWANHYASVQDAEISFGAA